MIRKILTYYAARLDDYLSRTHHRPEGLATVGMIGNSTEERPNKMVVNLLGVERETAGGINSPVQRIPDGGYVRMQPPLLLNLNVMLAEMGGSSTSAHRSGYAFDLVPLNGRMRSFKSFCRTFLADHAFDQLISEGENSKGLPRWMHVGYKHPDGVKQRGQFLSMINGKYCPMTK